jgi:hypothetical protein
MDLLAAIYQPDKLSFYNVVLFLHVTSAIVAFGVTFAYPLFARVAHQSDPANLPYFHRSQAYVGSRLITGGATLILLTGIVMAATSDAYDFSDPFVSAGLVIVIVILGMGGAFFSPLEGKLGDLAERDVKAAGGGPVVLSRQYHAASHRYNLGAALAVTLVLVAVLLMVIKPL